MGLVSPESSGEAALPHTASVTVGTDEAASRLTVVMLHGYAMEPQALVPFAHSLGVPARYWFPRGICTAPEGGWSWWPVDEARRSDARARGARDLHGEHPTGRAPARVALAGLLRQVAPRQPGARVVLAGFSQGGMLACDTLLYEDVRVDALALFSSSRIALDEWEHRRQRLAGLPVLVAHGQADADLAFSAGRALHDWLQYAGANTRWAGFDGGHEIPLPVWREFRKFLRDVSPGAPPVPVPCE